jgi:hypothetical protein
MFFLYQLLNKLIYVHEIQYWGRAVDGDLDAIINPVASTIPNWRTFKILRRMQKFGQSSWGHCVLFADRSSKHEQLLISPVSWKKNRNVASGYKLTSVFLWRQLMDRCTNKSSLVQWNIMEISASFIRIIISFDEASKYDDGAKFRYYVRTNNEP